MSEVCPRIMIAGTSGDAGKTILSLGLLGVLTRRGMKTAAFKKGPDFIDAAWLGRVAGQAGRNLDTFMMDEPTIIGSFVNNSAVSDIAVIEGNRGLHDGQDAQGTHSTAVLAALLGAPIILIHQVRKATRTAAAAIMGCCTFDPRVNVAGVVLNGVAGKRHQRVITESLEQAGGPPVVGAIPRFDDPSLLPGRHLGLVTPEEHPDPEQALNRATEIIDEYVDVNRIIELAGSRPFPHRAQPSFDASSDRPSVARIGYFRDAAFTFYYPENLEALNNAGAKLVPIAAVDDDPLPADLDGLYIGGGFPETHARQLADNTALRDAVHVAAERGMPIYAECGGLVFLAKSLQVDEIVYPMAGVFPVELVLEKRPQGHGYCRMIVDRENPYFPVGKTINAHEFHYTRIANGAENSATVCAAKLGRGSFNRRDGLVVQRTMASYFHLHALGTPEWAPNFVRLAGVYCAERGSSTESGNTAISTASYC